MHCLGVPIGSAPRFYFPRNKTTLIIHHYHHVRYAIPQHSSKVVDNHSNSSRSESTRRQEAKLIVCRFVSQDGAPLSARSLSLILLRPCSQQKTSLTSRHAGLCAWRTYGRRPARHLGARQSGKFAQRVSCLLGLLCAWLFPTPVG